MDQALSASNSGMSINTINSMTNSVPESFSKRKAIAERILDRYRDRIPILLRKADKSALSTLVHRKYIVPRDISIGKFLRELRMSLKLQEHQSLFLLIEQHEGKSFSLGLWNKSILPLSTEMIGSLYNKYRSDDYFLHLVYTEENTFGV